MSEVVRRLVLLLLSVLGATTAPGALAAPAELDPILGDRGRVVLATPGPTSSPAPAAPTGVPGRAPASRRGPWAVRPQHR